MEDINQKAVDQAAQNYQNYAQHASQFNWFGGDLMGFDATYSSNEALLASKYQNAFNSAEAAKNRNWQEYMSNTANQRAVRDLKEAGFSPLALLGNTSSASTPSGSAASSGGTFGGSGSKSGEMFKSLMSTIMLLGMSSASVLAKKQMAQASNITKATIAKMGTTSLAKHYGADGLLKGMTSSSTVRK